MILEEYKDTMTRIIQMYYPVSKQDLEPILDYSISKRYKEYKCEVVNTYTNQKSSQTLLALADYIASKEPIVTSYGTMFKKHGTVKNPIAIVTEQFLSERDIFKNEMFKWPKGSEDFEKYNLLQILAKIDVNGKVC
jgi:cobalamin-dependent methionine synthase I